MSHSSEGLSILPKVVLSRASSFVRNNAFRLVPSVSLHYCHLTCVSRNKRMFNKFTKDFALSHCEVELCDKFYNVAYLGGYGNIVEHEHGLIDPNIGTSHLWLNSRISLAFETRKF